MKRQELINELANILTSQKQSHPLRVGINGVDASGKTYFADELAAAIQARNTIRASIDGFHNPREVRYKKGRNSPEGYYYNSFNHQEFITALLKPLSPSGNRIYTTATFDHKSNSRIHIPARTANNDDILLVDGIFLFRQELQKYWDVKIFLDVPFSLSAKRAVKRDGKGRELEEVKMQNERYIPGQELYFADSKPKQQAHIIINNSDFLNPSFIVNNLT